MLTARKSMLIGMMAIALLATSHAAAHADPVDPPSDPTSAASPTVEAPNWPGGECTLSDPHVVFDDESATNPKLSMSWAPSAAAPIDPSNANFHLRTTTVGITNLSSHTYYDTTYFISWLWLLENATAKYNYAAWNSTTNLFDTEVPPSFPWLGGWAPRDSPPAGTPGAQATLGPGTVAGNPLPPAVVSPEQLGKAGSWGGETRPGYALPSISPSANQSFTQVLRIERPTGNGAYAFLQYRVVSVATCLPAPAIEQPTVGDDTLHGTGTTAGDTITITDQNGIALGTTMVQSDLTWSITLGSPLESTITSLTATAVDEFSLEGNAETPVNPIPVPPTIANPASVAVACSGTATFTTSVTGGVPTPNIVWEQSSDGGDTWEPASGLVSDDGLSLTVSATTADNGMQYRAAASSSAGSATSAAATLTVSPCLIDVTPIAPRATDPSECGVEQSFKTTPVTGVTYVQERVGNKMRFTAAADPGYVLTPQSTNVWEFDIAAVVRCEESADRLPLTGDTGAATFAGLGALLMLGGTLLLARRRNTAE